MISSTLLLNYDRVKLFRSPICWIQSNTLSQLVWMGWFWDWSVLGFVCFVCLFFPHFFFIYQLKSLMKFWKPSSPKKSNEPWDEPRWMSRRTSRTTARSGISMFQPAARMLYHLALSEHSWANCRLPWVFWSRAYTDTQTHILFTCKHWSHLY